VKLSYRRPHDKNKSKPYGVGTSHATVREAPACGSSPPIGTVYGIPEWLVWAPSGTVWESQDWASNGTVCEVPTCGLALYCNLGHDGIGLPCHYMCRPGHRVALNVEPRHAGLGLPWHYILSLNTPVWTSYSTTFLV